MSTQSNSDVSVDPSALEAQGERLASLAGDFSIVADYASDADPDWHMWGVPGIALAQLYFASADRVQEILREFDPATAGLGRRFTDCASSYIDGDDQIAGTFGQIGGELGGQVGDEIGGEVPSG